MKSREYGYPCRFRIGDLVIFRAVIHEIIDVQKYRFFEDLIRIEDANCSSRWIEISKLIPYEE